LRGVEERTERIGVGTISLAPQPQKFGFNTTQGFTRSFRHIEYFSAWQKSQGAASIKLLQQRNEPGVEAGNHRPSGPGVY
jgi:hypothetical protein